MKTRNAIFIADGRINCEIDHPVHGWIPFTASPDDPEKSGRDLFAELKSKAAAHVPHNPKKQEIAAALAQARAAAIEEIIADTERKRLDAVRDAVAVEFKDAKSEKDVSDKLAQLKLAAQVKA